MVKEDEKKDIEKITKQDFYFETSLYKKLSYSDLEDINNLFKGYVDTNDTTYSLYSEWVYYLESVNSVIAIYPLEQHSGFRQVTLNCLRRKNDTIIFLIYHDEISQTVEKIGQYPSLADIQFAEIGKKYDKVLEEQYLNDLRKAIGLYAHSVGAGSLVYLRRIFENIIWNTYQEYKEHKKLIKITESDFKTLGMEGKVKVLESFLPTNLVKMQCIYVILSKGVHELSEEECLKYFNSLKLSITLILDQKIAEENKKKQEDLVKKEIQNIAKQVNTKNKTKKE
jgi:hypothetical protein